MVGTHGCLIIIGQIPGSSPAVVPGRQATSVLETILLGMSAIGRGLPRPPDSHHGHGLVQTSSWIGSIIGSMIVLLVAVGVQARARLRLNSAVTECLALTSIHRGVIAEWCGIRGGEDCSGEYGWVRSRTCARLLSVYSKDGGVVVGAGLGCRREDLGGVRGRSEAA
jgi:hypothetical protein